MVFECSTAGNGGVGTQQRLSFSVCRTWKIEWKIYIVGHKLIDLHEPVTHGFGPNTTTCSSIGGEYWRGVTWHSIL